MAATNGSKLGKFQGATFAATFSNPANLDVLQVYNEGGKCVFSVDHTGVAHTNPASPTATALMWRLFGSSIQNAFDAPSFAYLDVFQIFKEYGAVTWYLDHTGVVHTS